MQIQGIYHILSHQSYRFLPSIIACPDSTTKTHFIKHKLTSDGPTQALHRPVGRGARGPATLGSAALLVNTQPNPHGHQLLPRHPPFPSTNSHNHSNRFTPIDTRHEQHYLYFAAVTQKPGTRRTSATTGRSAVPPQRATDASCPSPAHRLTPQDHLSAWCKPQAWAKLPFPTGHRHRRDAA